MFVHRYLTVFKDESKLDINYVPPRLPHREFQLNLLMHFFRFAVENPGKMAQRVLISGKVGTGKTVLSQHFGLLIGKEAEKKEINLKCVHINCRECKGSLFMILQRAIVKFYPRFPRRGYGAEELLQMLMEILDERNGYLILVMDELEALIRNEGSDPLYNLSRIQEERINAPQRLSLICVLRRPEYLERLDHSTRSTLQRNIIHLEEYSKPQLQEILTDRVSFAFKQDSVSSQIIDFIAETAAESGDARYAIDVLWRAGKYADASSSTIVLPDCVRKAASSIYPIIRKSSVSSLGYHEKLFLLGLARWFKQSKAAYISMREAEDAYAIVCEEYSERQRRHTQLWKYVKELSVMGLIKKETSGAGHRGKTTLISLPRIPASDLEQELSRLL